MRTHQQIISDAGGYQALAASLGLENERVRFWERRASIPLDGWPLIEQAGIATHEELYAAALAKTKHQNAAA